MSYEAFVEDELRRDAAIRNLEIIGEKAVRNLLTSSRHLPWPIALARSRYHR